MSFMLYSFTCITMAFSSLSMALDAPIKHDDVLALWLSSQSFSTFRATARGHIDESHEGACQLMSERIGDLIGLKKGSIAFVTSGLDHSFVAIKLETEAYEIASRSAMLAPFCRRSFSYNSGTWENCLVVNANNFDAFKEVLRGNR